MSQPTPRQVLYALVAAGFLAVVAILVIGAAAAGAAPTWWTVSASVALLAVAALSWRRWRDTRSVLLLAIGLLLGWVVVTLLLAR